MNNDYICELKIDLNFTEVEANSTELKSHQRLVKDNHSLAELHSKFPFLGSIYNIYVFPPKQGLPIHIDSARKCAINIPISNTLESATIFYKLEDPIILEHVEDRVYDKILSDSTEIFRFTLKMPTLINNTIAHSAINYSDSPRIVLSWGLKNNIDFNLAKEMLNEYIL